jgi:hypothetical protein
MRMASLFGTFWAVVYHPPALPSLPVPPVVPLLPLLHESMVESITIDNPLVGGDWNIFIHLDYFSMGISSSQLTNLTNFHIFQYC